MSTSPLRAPMVPITHRMRAYFAPVDRGSETPTIFDPGKYGLFPLDSPPSPWLDLGWIDGFQRFSGSITEPLRSGSAAAPATQFRAMLDARIAFDFREWGKLQMALACGFEHMNVLATDPDADAQPSGGTPLSAVAVLPGSTATEIVVGAGAAASFAAGDIVVVEADYQQQTGYVGTGISAAYISDPASVNRDVNYVRRVSFNVGRVAQTTSTSLLLAQSLLGGSPLAGFGVQKVIAFVDREGGSFFQEWSGLFVAEQGSGGRVCFHYPRLSPSGPYTSLSPSSPVATGAVKLFPREEALEIASPIASLALHAAFIAMPHVDENDGQTVMCYRSYFPAGMAAIY